MALQNFVFFAATPAPADPAVSATRRAVTTAAAVVTVNLRMRASG
jgi:hypothetical protein